MKSVIFGANGPTGRLATARALAARGGQQQAGLDGRSPFGPLRSAPTVLQMIRREALPANASKPESARPASP
jgi:hypothetical protein